ncbi:MAG: hypothetical protein ABH817_01405 [archaeon]
MNFDELLRRGRIRKTSKDISRIKSLLKTADNDLQFLQKIKIDKISSRTVMTGYYRVLRSILEAMASINGYKIYFHEAFKEFLKNKGEGIIAEKFDRLRKIRNKLTYYGEDISPEETKENVAEVLSLVKHLKAKYLKKL